MDDNSVEKRRGPLDPLRETSGIYGLGFERESFLGFILPWVIVIGVGGVLGLIIWRWL